MADTVRTRAALQALLADNTAGDISAQDVRDFLATVYGYPYAADAVPASPNAMDDEFDDGAIDAKWTATHVGTAPVWSEKVDGRLYSQFAAEAGQRWKGQHQPIPAGDFDIRVKISSNTASYSDYHKPSAIFVSAGTTTASDAVQFLCVLKRSGNTQTLQVTRFSNWSTWSSDIASTAYTSNPVVYLRVTRTGTTYGWSFSEDGNTFVDVGTPAALTFTPTIIGIGGTNEQSSAGPVGATYEWFRRIS